MNFLVLFTILCVSVHLGNASEDESGFITEDVLSLEFRHFKQVYLRRAYRTQAEEIVRKRIFATNLAYIYRHNAQPGNPYRLAVNQFADMTNEEFRQSILQTRVRPNRTAIATHPIPDALQDLPASVDWVAKGKVVPIKDQGQCGSAVAFGSVASIESANAIATNNLVSLSEQQVVDCCSSDHSCNGSPMSDDDVFECIIKMKGIDTEASYPSGSTKCEFNPNTIGAIISGYVDVTKGSESALQSAVANAGPVAVEIDASQESFQFYSSGVYDEPACATDQANHAVAVVGYGTEQGVAFWKVKNSWGTNWGEQGYIQMSRNKQNQCGIASLASYPVV